MAFMVCADDDVEEMADDDEDEEDEVEDCFPPLYFDICNIEICTVFLVQSSGISLKLETDETIKKYDHEECSVLYLYSLMLS